MVARVTYSVVALANHELSKIIQIKINHELIQIYIDGNMSDNYNLYPDMKPDTFFVNNDYILKCYLVLYIYIYILLM